MTQDTTYADNGVPNSEGVVQPFEAGEAVVQLLELQAAGQAVVLYWPFSLLF